MVEIVARLAGRRRLDVQRTMRKIQRRIAASQRKRGRQSRENRRCTPPRDGVHLNAFGQLAMAYAILKGPGRPGDRVIRQFNIDARDIKLSSFHESIWLLRDGGFAATWRGIEFVRLDRWFALEQRHGFRSQFASFQFLRNMNRTG